jgi:hypothetical protein
MELISVAPSPSSTKKYKALFKDKEGHHKTVQFGAKGYTDFTKLSAEHDPTAEEHRRRYRQRHEKDLTGDPISPGYMSYWILWNKPTFRASLQDYRRRFNL